MLHVFADVSNLNGGERQRPTQRPCARYNVPWDQALDVLLDQRALA